MKRIITMMLLYAASVKKYFIMVLIGLLVMVSIIKAQNDPWTAKCPLPERNTWFASCTLNGKIYVVGGAADLTVLSAVEVYDPATDTWKTKAEMPTRRLALSASVAEGKIYTFGGATVGYPWIPSLTTVEEYNASLDQTTNVENSLLVQDPNQFLLFQNYPNPFNSETTIEYNLPKSGNVNISIYNLLGERISGLTNSFQNAGSYEIRWNGKDDSGNSLPEGIYILELSLNDYKQFKNMILIK